MYDITQFNKKNQNFKMCTDEVKGTWEQMSLRNLSEDTYFNDGLSVEEKFGMIKGVTDSTNPPDGYLQLGTTTQKQINDLKQELNEHEDYAEKRYINVDNIKDQSVAFATKAGDADTLDGHHGTDYALKNHNHNGVYQPAGNYLTQSDGDARYMSVNERSSYIKNGALNNYYTKDTSDGRYLKLSGGTMTGKITMNKGGITMNDGGITINKGGLDLENEGITMNNCAITGVSGISGVNTPGDEAGLQIFSATGNSATNKDIFLVCKRTRCVHYGFTGALNTYADLYCDRLHYVNPPMTDSSRLVKENITDMSNEEAEKILDVDVKDFDYIEGFGDKGQHGVIAEELEEILPNLVYTPEGYREEDFDASKGAVDNKVKSVSYVGFIPYMLKVIQIQNEKIKELENKVEMLSK